MRNWIALLLLAGVAFGQSGIPRFNGENLKQRPDGRPALLSPGIIVTIYGEDLGPEFQCPEPIAPNGPYPIETCGVRVLVDGRPAGLLFSGSKQINFKIPDDAPEDGSAPIQVCVHDACSDRVVVRFSSRKAFIHVVGPRLRTHAQFGSKQTSLGPTFAILTASSLEFRRRPI